MQLVKMDEWAEAISLSTRRCCRTMASMFQTGRQIPGTGAMVREWLSERGAPRTRTCVVAALTAQG